MEITMLWNRNYYLDDKIDRLIMNCWLWLYLCAVTGTNDGIFYAARFVYTTQILRRLFKGSQADKVTAAPGQRVANPRAERKKCRLNSFPKALFPGGFFSPSSLACGNFGWAGVFKAVVDRDLCCSGGHTQVLGVFPPSEVRHPEKP